jgi:hypothetical protein
MSYDAAKLKRLFRHYNQRYWNGELPDYRIRFGRLPGHGLIKQYPEMAAKHELTLEGMGHCDRRNRTLWFDPLNIRGDRMWRIILMHEMSHIRARPGHSGTFFRELCRCPDYVVLHECGGNKETFAFVKYGIRPRRPHV